MSSWTLYVPMGSKNKYESATFWNKFGYIYEGSPGFVEDACTSDVSFSANEGKIIFSGIVGDVPVALYSLDGRCIYAETISTDKTVTISHKGLPILKIANKHFKVLI